jgi:hypothetical protein
MRAHDHDRDVEPAPRHRRVPAEAARPATGPLDVLGAAGLLNLQRTVGNAGVSALVEEEQSPVLDVVGKGGGRPLDPDLRSDMESQFGTGFGEVRVHTGDAARASAQSLHAQAYTVGSDIVLAGDADLDSPAGRHLLAHELTHVVQQRSGPVDGTDIGGGIALSDPGDRFEREAAATADAMVQRQVVDEDELDW